MVIFLVILIKLFIMEWVLYIGSWGMLLVFVLLMVFLFLRCDFWIYELLIFVLFLMIGMIFIVFNILVMECEWWNVGIVLVFLGVIGFVFGGIVLLLVSLGDMMIFIGILFLVGFVCVYVCIWYVLL